MPRYSQLVAASNLEPPTSATAHPRRQVQAPQTARLAATDTAPAYPPSTPDSAEGQTPAA